MLQEKMNKTFLKLVFAGLIAFAFLGCETAQPQTPSASKSTNKKAKGFLTEEEQALLNRLNEECNPNRIETCMNAVALLYDNGLYLEAASGYRQLCASLDYVPACLKLADMYNKGVGVKKNVDLAKQIWERACYHGDKPSCSKFK